MLNELCVVDTKNLWVYDFAKRQEDAENILQKAIETNKNDIETWENNCRSYPDVEKFKTYLEETRNKKYEIMTYNDFIQLERNHYINQPLTEVTEEIYWEMLEVLPPRKWCTINSVEMFCMSEMLTGYYTSQYLHDRTTDKYYHKIVDITDQNTWGYNFIQ